MKAYFDSNVYDFVYDRDALDAVASYLHEARITLLGSDENLLEIGRTPDRDRRDRLVRTLTSLVKVRLPPAGFVEAKELVGEVRRCRPEWLRARPDETTLNYWLNQNRDRWRIAKRTLQLPPGEVFDRVVERTSGALKEQQRDARARFGDQLQGRTFTKEEADQIWRMQASAIWGRALFERATELRDLYDYFTAYAAAVEVKLEDWRVFWKDEARGAAMPATMLRGLAVQYQVGSRATYGNAGDLNHVSAALASDVFVTCDGAFYDVLRRVGTHHSPIASFVLLDKRNSRPVAELSGALERAHPTHAPERVTTATIVEAKGEDE